MATASLPSPQAPGLPQLPQNTGSLLLGFWDVQLRICATVVDLVSRVNPFLPKEKMWLDAMAALQREIRDYSAEENLRPSNPLLGLQNGLNPYHLFLEWQKTRKFFFEAMLIQIKRLKLVFPLLAPHLQQSENYIRANLAFTFTFHRPDWNLDFAHETVESLDFADIVKFEAPSENPNGRNMLLIAPMSGHFATLLRKTIESLHREWYTVYITDWKSPFDVPKDKWEFTIDRYTTEVLHAYAAVEKDGWVFDVLAICQPSPETLTATTFAETHNLPKPRSLALMAGPIDVSQSPTKVNEASGKLNDKVLDSFRLTIPSGKNIWAGRSVYPAPLQILSFISTKPEEHMWNYNTLAFKTTPLSPEEEKMLAFYEEYFAVMDLPHEFYRDTVKQVFRGNNWAKGKVDYNWEEVDFSAMTTPLMTIEWGRDDICGIGQTEAAQKLTNPSHSLHIVLPDAGHYGTFAGKDFRGIVLPAFDGFYQSLEEGSEDWKKVYPKLRAVT